MALVMLFLGLASFLAKANEAEYPSKPITIVVAYAPGGQGDAFARIISDRLSQIYKQSVVVDNRPGVSGVVGTRLAAKSKNDGYTLFLGQTGEMVVNRAMMKDLGFDPIKDFIPVVLIGNAPLVLLVSADSPINSVNQLVELAKTKPGQLSFGSVGAGTPGHLAATALSLGIKSEMVHVPYKGVGPLMADLMSQRLDFFFQLNAQLVNLTRFRWILLRAGVHLIKIVFIRDIDHKLSRFKNVSCRILHHPCSLSDIDGQHGWISCNVVVGAERSGVDKTIQSHGCDPSYRTRHYTSNDQLIGLSRIQPLSGNINKLFHQFALECFDRYSD